MNPLQIFLLHKEVLLYLSFTFQYENHTFMAFYKLSISKSHLNLIPMFLFYFEMVAIQAVNSDDEFFFFLIFKALPIFVILECLFNQK
jgi:hypothetical protein